MTILSALLRATAITSVLAATSVGALAKDVTISVWAGGSGPNDNYRTDAIEIAADLLEREAAIRGEELNITVEKTSYNGWDDFKQALTLSAEAGAAPNIVVSGHEDIAPWSQSGLIVPVGGSCSVIATSATCPASSAMSGSCSSPMRSTRT